MIPLRRWFLISAAAAVGGCSTAAPRATTVDAPPPPVTPVVSVQPKPGSWVVRYTPGRFAYRISRTAAIESIGDSILHREVSTNSTHTLITVEETSSDTLRLIAVVDTFAITTQSRIGSVQAIQLPIQLNGLLQGNALVLDSTDAEAGCSPARSVLATDLHNLFPTVPTPLQSGIAWKDSIAVDGCQAGIPTHALIFRSFNVSGEVILDGQPAIVIERSDSLVAQGDGAQQQHRVTLVINGTGHATYYIEPATSRVVKLSTEQKLRIAMSASARLAEVSQISQQEFNLVR